MVVGLVRFFGVFPIYCRIGTAAGAEAKLATLDVVSGVELIRECRLLSLPEPALTVSLEEASNSIFGWLAGLANAAAQRGATHPPTFNVQARLPVIADAALAGSLPG